MLSTAFWDQVSQALFVTYYFIKATCQCYYSVNVIKYGMCLSQRFSNCGVATLFRVTKLFFWVAAIYLHCPITVDLRQFAAIWVAENLKYFERVAMQKSFRTPDLRDPITYYISKILKEYFYQIQGYPSVDKGEVNKQNFGENYIFIK